MSNSKSKGMYENMKTINEFIQYYHSALNGHWTKDFADKNIADAVDDLMRLINSYETDFGDEGNKVSKLKSLLKNLENADNKIK